MPRNLSIVVVNTHAEGEVGNVVVSGVEPPPGDTLWDQMEWLQRDGNLRSFLLNEPRGGVYNHFNLLVPAKHPDADFGFLTMEPEHTPPMSGSNSMCVATVLLETGRVRMVEPVTVFTLESAAGLVKVRANCKNGKAVSVQITNVASFVDRLAAPLEIAGLGTLTVDIAFGGDSFVIVPAGDLGFSLTPDEAREITEIGAKITRAANQQLGFSHPVNNWSHISFCQMTLPVSRVDGVLSGKSTVVIDPGKLDRLPCGTGCSARMAVLSAQGKLLPQERYIGRSIIDSRFDCQVVGETRIGDKPAIIPSLQGRAWICGETKLLCDPSDPWPRGYRLSDTWPNLPG
ncbi:MAG: proline racemase family protein [Rhodobacteraceae bacterium]|nr:proline racemase family protein [Paracoccaceae bacterium]